MPDTARRNLSDERLTRVVLESFENAQTPRIAEVLQALVKHLHAFATEVQLTEGEWTYAIDFLTRTGHITDDKRQEFILLSDVLGLSMQGIGINHPVPDGATEKRPRSSARSSWPTRRSTPTATTSPTAPRACPATSTARSPR